MKGKSAIILGATGLTGRLLFNRLLEDSRYERIILFSRSTSDKTHPKLTEHLIDLFELENYREKFQADEVYCCVGTTKKKTPDKENYRKVDIGIPVTAAKLCRTNGITKFAVISALGANSKSRIFYNRTKGEMEDQVLDQDIRNTYIFQPSLITGNRKEKRFGEDFAKQAMKVFDSLLMGPLKEYRSIHPEVIAKAMIFVMNNNYRGNKISSGEIKEIAAQSELNK